MLTCCPQALNCQQLAQNGLLTIKMKLLYIPNPLYILTYPPIGTVRNQTQITLLEDMEFNFHNYHNAFDVPTDAIP